MKTIEVKVGKPSKFYNNGKRIDLDTAFGMYQKGAKFAANGKKINLNKFGTLYGGRGSLDTEDPGVLALAKRLPQEMVDEIGSYILHPVVRFEEIGSHEYKFVEFRNENGQLHRLGGPAQIYYRKDEAGNWTVKHRESWFKNDQLHREDGPAVIEYYNDGVIKSEMEQWFKNGQRHREDGPAVIEYVWGNIYDKRWYEDGKEISQEEHRRKQIRQSGRRKVLRTARLLALQTAVPQANEDVLSMVGGFLE